MRDQPLPQVNSQASSGAVDKQTEALPTTPPDSSDSSQSSRPNGLLAADHLSESQQDFILNKVTQVFSLWGFPKSCGAIWGALYFTGTPLSIKDMIQLLPVELNEMDQGLEFLKAKGFVKKKKGSNQFMCGHNDLSSLIYHVIKEQNEFLQSVDQALTAFLQSDEKTPLPFNINRLQEFKKLTAGIGKALKLAALINKV